jgi:hypothetical protein
VLDVDVVLHGLLFFLALPLAPLLTLHLLVG